MSDTVEQRPTLSVAKSQNLTSRMMVPIVLATIIALAGVWVILPGRVANMATEQATLLAAETVSQFKTVRSY
jgi:hypothetical protein